MHCSLPKNSFVPGYSRSKAPEFSMQIGCFLLNMKNVFLCSFLELVIQVVVLPTSYHNPYNNLHYSALERE